MKKTIAIVTGASSGMGRDFVLELLKDKTIEEIWMIARREERLKIMEAKCPKRLRAVALDLTDESSYETLEKLLRSKKIEIAFLVNAAGAGKMGTIEEISREDHGFLVDLNVKALTCLTRISLPFMKKESHIIQLCSGAAFFPQPGFSTYAACKAYVLSFTRALREEVKIRRIHVTAVCPGPVHTEFFQAAGSEIHPKKKYFLAKSKDVVQKAMKDAKAGKELSIYGKSVNALHILGKCVPTKIVFMAMNLMMKE